MRFVFALLAVCATTVSAQACGFMGQPPCYPVQNSLNKTLS
jgi:hypothetical protein